MAPAATRFCLAPPELVAAGLSFEAVPNVARRSFDCESGIWWKLGRGSGLKPLTMETRRALCCFREGCAGDLAAEPALEKKVDPGGGFWGCWTGGTDLWYFAVLGAGS